MQFLRLDLCVFSGVGPHGFPGYADSMDQGLRLTDNSCFQESPPPLGRFTSSMSSIKDHCHLLLQVTRKQKDVVVFTEHTYLCAVSTPDTGLHRQSGSTVNVLPIDPQTKLGHQVTGLRSTERLIQARLLPKPVLSLTLHAACLRLS